MTTFNISESELQSLVEILDYAHLMLYADSKNVSSDDTLEYQRNERLMNAAADLLAEAENQLHPTS